MAEVYYSQQGKRGYKFLWERPLVLTPLSLYSSLFSILAVAHLLLPLFSMTQGIIASRSPDPNMLAKVAI